MPSNYLNTEKKKGKETINLCQNGTGTSTTKISSNSQFLTPQTQTSKFNAEKHSNRNS